MLQKIKRKIYYKKINLLRVNWRILFHEIYFCSGGSDGGGSFCGLLATLLEEEPQETRYPCL